MNSLAKLLEAALFASPRPIATEELAALDPDSSPAGFQAALDELREHYNVDGHGVELVEVGGGWQVLTRPEYTEAIERAQMAVRPQRLSAAALETLAIVAYRQPIGRADVAEIRGVDVGAVLKSLHERGLIDVIGRAEGLGRPLLYGTTRLFLEQFALRHLGELPRVDELAIALRKNGEEPTLAADVIADEPEPAVAEPVPATAAAAATADAASDVAPVTEPVLTTTPEGAEASAEGVHPS